KVGLFTLDEVHISSCLPELSEKTAHEATKHFIPNAPAAWLWRMRMTTEKQSLLTRDGKLILVSVFVNSIPLGYMSVVPLVYLLKIGFSPITIGTIYAASGIANTVGYTPFGVLADRYGRKKFLIIGSL